jgi:hypothetical protein
VLGTISEDARILIRRLSACCEPAVWLKWTLVYANSLSLKEGGNSCSGPASVRAGDVSPIHIPSAPLGARPRNSSVMSQSWIASVFRSRRHPFRTAPRRDAPRAYKDRRLLVEHLEERSAPAGDFGFAAQFSSGNGIDFGRAVATDASGNVYVTGQLAGVADFDPGAGTTALAGVHDDVFVAKYTAAGALVWARQLGGTSADQGNAIAVDAAGNVFTTGTFQGTADFDPGAGAPWSESDRRCWPGSRGWQGWSTRRRCCRRRSTEGRRRSCFRQP